MVVSVDVRNGSDGKAYGSAVLSDGKDTLKFDCDVELTVRIQPFHEYNCYVEVSEQAFGNKVYNRRRLVEVLEPEEKN